MIIDFYNRNGGGGSSSDPQMRASGFTGVELSGTTLEFSNLGGTEVDRVDLSGIGGASDVLEPKSSIPASGAAGTLIAVNKPDEAGWGAYIPQSEVKSRNNMNYYVEPSENPNPDLSLYPNTFSFDVNVPDSKADGNYSWNVSSTIEGSVDYQNNITFTNLGNFTQDGDKYVWNVDWYDYDTSEQVYKTLVMEVVVENGHPYICFNLTDGDCPYDILLGYINRTYWQDYGNWEYDPETGEATAWTESWTEMSDYIYPQSWNIVSPAKIGIYQANSGGTYVEFNAKSADYATEAGFARKMKMYQGDIHNDHFNAGDMIVPNEGDYRPLVKTSEGDGFDGDFIRLADNNDVAVLQQRMNNLQIEEVYAKEDTPIYVDNGNLIAVHNSGETVVKQAYAESGFTYVPMGWLDTGYYGIKQSDGVGIGLYVQVGDGTNRAWIGLSFDGSSWDFSDMNDWSINQADTLTWDATDNYGFGWTLNAYNDGSYNYVEFSQPVVEFYGGSCEEKRVPQTAYQTAVMSKQGVCQIWKGTAQEYAQISTPDANTIYIII